MSDLRTFKWMLVFFLTAVIGSPLLAEQGAGLQADFLGQGLSYRLLSAGGFGFELVGRGRFDLQNNNPATYSFAGELRVIKVINPQNRFRIFLGAGVGAWLVKAWFENWEDYYDDWRTYYQLDTKLGMSSAFLAGIDWRFFKIGENNWLSVSPEVQVGFYSLPGGYYSYPYYYSEPYSFVSPGVGIGLKYVW